MPTLGPEHIHHLVNRTKSLSERLHSLREKYSGTVSKAVRTVEVAGAAFVGGVVEGRMGPDGATVFHIPINLLAGLALNLMGHFDVAGEKYSDHLCSFGDGFLATFTSSAGFNFGKHWHDSGHLFGHKEEPAALPPGGPQVKGHISPDAMAEIAQRMRAHG